MNVGHRDYSFTEWNGLTFEQQRDIVNNYWNPYEPELGRPTREAILSAFRNSLNAELEYCEHRYFGFYAEAIFAIPNELTTRLPTEFAGLTVNIGRKLERLENGEWIIKWKHSGTENLKLD